MIKSKKQHNNFTSLCRSGQDKYKFFKKKGIKN